MKKMFKEVSERVLNDLQSSAFKVGITRTGTKENTAAKAALELAKNALNAIWKEADQKYVRMATSGKRDSEKAKELLEIKLSIDSEIIFHRELIGTTDATNLKKSSTNEELQNVNNKPVFTKVDYANNLANAVSNSNSKRRRWDVYTIKNASALKGFDDIRDAANKVLNEGFDSFTVGDYFRLIA